MFITIVTRRSIDRNSTRTAILAYFAGKDGGGIFLVYRISKAGIETVGCLINQEYRTNNQLRKRKDHRRLDVDKRPV